MAKIEIDVPDDLVDQIDEKLGAGASGRVASAAFREWASWLLATARPLSVSDMETARVHSLYLDILVDELPSASHLSSRLQLPIARCRYIVQSLGYQYPALLRVRLLGALQKVFAAIPSQGDLFVMDVVPESAGMLDEMLGSIADQAELAPLKGKKHGSLIRYELTKGYYQRLGKAIAEEIKTAKGG